MRNGPKRRNHLGAHLIGSKGQGKRSPLILLTKRWDYVPRYDDGYGSGAHDLGESVRARRSAGRDKPKGRVQQTRVVVVVVPALQLLAVLRVFWKQMLAVVFEAVHRHDHPVRLVLKRSDAEPFFRPMPAEIDGSLRNV